VVAESSGALVVPPSTMGLFDSPRAGRDANEEREALSGSSEVCKSVKRDLICSQNRPTIIGIPEITSWPVMAARVWRNAVGAFSSRKT
jgi:hypothetical protein